MTREEAIDAMFETNYFGNLLDKIYDDFDDMICEKCIHFNILTIDGIIDCEVYGAIKSINGFGYDFGCNKFER